jgi:hypothetical protein
MSSATIFQLHLVRGYVPWLLCFGARVRRQTQAGRTLSGDVSWSNAR